MKLFYCTDLHGAEAPFAVLEGVVAQRLVDAVIVGGDLVGKRVIPAIRINGSYRLRLDASGGEETLGSSELQAFEERCAKKGEYVWRCSAEEYRDMTRVPVEDHNATIQEGSCCGALRWLRRGCPRSWKVPDAVAARLQIARLVRWLDRLQAAQSGSHVEVVVGCGNDDPWEIDHYLANAGGVRFGENTAVSLPGGLCVVSLAAVPMTPWRSPRDVSRAEMADLVSGRLMQLGSDFRGAILNFHSPPFGTQMDLAPKLDRCLRPRLTPLGPQLEAVGCRFIRREIEELQPLLGLHGHIHEMPATVSLGRTLLVNPGSDYELGVLRAAVVTIDAAARITGCRLLEDASILLHRTGKGGP